MELNGNPGVMTCVLAESSRSVQYHENKHEMNSVTTMTTKAYTESTSNVTFETEALMPGKANAANHQKVSNGSYLSDYKSKVPVEIRFESIKYVVPVGFAGQYFKTTLISRNISSRFLLIPVTKWPASSFKEVQKGFVSRIDSRSPH